MVSGGYPITAVQRPPTAYFRHVFPPLRPMSDAAPPKRRLLHVFPGFDIGGVQLRIASVLNRFPDRYDNVIVAMNDRFEGLSRIGADASVTPLPPSLPKGRSIRTFRGIDRQLATVAPDLLVTYNWGAIEWALVNRLRRRIPHLHMESGFGPEEADRQIRRRVLLRRFALAKTRHVIVPSLNLLGIARDAWELPESQLLYVPNGVDIDRFSAPPDRSLLPAGWPGMPIVGTVAPMRPEKNLARLVRAFAAVAVARDTRLLLVGDGPERPALEGLVAQLGVADRVHFAGYIDAPERAFGLMDVYAISSDTEQMPNALIQAMAASRPVVGTAVGDIRQIVAAENRPFIVPAANEDAFRTSLRRLIGDAGARASIGAANRRRVAEDYGQERMFDIYRKLFDGGTIVAESQVGAAT